MKLVNNSLHINMQSLIDDCQTFYNNTMYEKSDFESFKKGLEEITAKIDGLDKEAQMEELATYFQPFIDNKSKNHFFAEGKKSSKIIATVYLYNKEIFNEALEGGKVNFSDYVQCYLESCTTKDNTVKLLMDEKMRLALKSMAEMRYYRHNPPDREMY